MKFVKENWKFFVFIVIAGIIGSIFTTIYSLKFITPEIMEKTIKQVGSKEAVMAISIIQPIIYTIVLGIFGIILSNKIGLWKKLNIKKEPLIKAIIVSILGGILLILGDLLIFGHFNEIIKNSYDIKPTYDYIIGAIFYGGVVEEVMMRLFLMSLLSFIIYKTIYKKEQKIPVKVYVISNIICAILFAIGHFPATIQTFGSLDALLIIRSLIMNGGFGLLFGWLYRKYGIQYSMIAHAGCHIISKIIWLLL